MRLLDAKNVPLDGVQLIEASAGTGKTYTITTLFLRLLLERQLDIDQIVVVTFTNAATAELRERVRSRLLEARAAFEAGDSEDEALRALVRRSQDPQASLERVRRALAETDEARILTIHGFCQRMLLENAFESGLGFDVELVPDLRPMIAEIVHDFWSLEVSSDDAAKVRFLRDRKLTLGALVSLAQTAIAWPEMPIVPTPPGEAPDGLLEDFHRHKSEAGAVWRSCRDEIVGLLTKSIALHRQSYKPEKFRTWFAQLDEFFSKNELSLDGFDDAVTMLRQSTLRAKTKRGLQTPEHSFFVCCDQLFDAHARAQQVLGTWIVEFKEKLVEFARTQAERRKLETGTQSFDDLLYQMARALRGSAGGALAARINQRYPAALIDEFQDTDPIQYEVFRRLYEKSGSLFLIGDPKQAIYGFRGADIFSYLGAVRDAGDNVWTLGTNYRSDPALVGALNGLFSRPHRPFLLEGIDYHPVESRPHATNQLTGEQATAFEILFLGREEAGTAPKRVQKSWLDTHLPEWLAHDIAQLLESDTRLGERTLRPSDIAVLTRTNDQARDVQDELRRLGIPSVLAGDKSVFDSIDARELAHLLRAMAEPGNDSALKCALSTVYLGVSANELAQLAEGPEQWEAWLEGFRRWHELWQKSGFVHAIQSLMRDRAVTARTLGRLDGERRLTNLRHLVELLHRAETEHHLGMSGLLQWFDDVRFNEKSREGMAPDAQQIRLESDALAVQLTTMHKSKGLEYPIVYCPYLWGEPWMSTNEKENLRFHDSESDNLLKLDLRAEDDKKQAMFRAREEGRAESLRMLYVALTRAKHKTLVVWGAFNKAEDSPLGYLLHQPAEDLGAMSEGPQGRLSNMSDSFMFSELRALEQRSVGNIAVRRLTLCPKSFSSSYDETSAQLTALSFDRHLDKAFRTSSFSALTKNPQALSLPASVGRDIDDDPEPPLEGSRPGHEALHQNEVLLSEFPRGTKPGDLLHSILEYVDFQDPTDHSAIVAEQLERHGFVSDWQEVVTRAVSEIVLAPLSQDHPKLSLSRIGRKHRVSEMEFNFPVAQGKQAARRLVTPKRLADVFRRYSDLPSSYVERLAELGFAPLEGYLRGFIDLVFEHEGRFFVVDYKSNYLGRYGASYASTSLDSVMSHHHYHLQYHLYLLALHRYLESRLPGYDYDRHVGGALYLFLRGMSEAGPPGASVFSSRPSRDCIAHLSTLFETGNSDESQVAS